MKEQISFNFEQKPKIKWLWGRDRFSSREEFLSAWKFLSRDKQMLLRAEFSDEWKRLSRGIKIEDWIPFKGVGK